MINQSFILLSAGGLFDFGATLPLLAIQFLVLMAVLNLILYTPLLKTIDDRTSYVVSNLSKSAELLEKVDVQLNTYETDLKERRKSAQAELVQSQKEYKQIVTKSLDSIDTLINSSVNDVTKKILGRTSQLFQVMFNDDSDASSSTLSSQLFYNIYFPNYSAKASSGLLKTVVKTNTMAYKARSSKKKISKVAYLATKDI